MSVKNVSALIYLISCFSYRLTLKACFHLLAKPFFFLLLLVVKALPLVSAQACSLLPTQPVITDGNDNPGWHRGLVNCSDSALNNFVIVTCLLKPRVNIVSLCSWSCLALHSECLYHHLLCGPDACVLIQKGAGASMARLVHCECLPSPPLCCESECHRQDQNALQ